MNRVLDRARRERERLTVLEHRATAQAEARAVTEGVEETVILARARGAAFEEPKRARGQRATPYRRQAGLDFLAGKARISPAQKLAGERYGACFRRAAVEGSIPSTLDVKPRASAPGGRPLSVVLAHAEGTVQAQARLQLFRRQLCHQPDLVAACDLVCGQELTPREAADSERDAGKLEAVLAVALDILVRHDRAIAAQLTARPART